MRITTKGRYALRAVVNLAKTNEKRPIPIKKIAKDEKISPEFLEQIFFRLKKSGIINSIRGPGGGFMINKPLEEISVRAIFDAVGEGLSLTPCTSCQDNKEEQCENIEDCAVYHVWVQISELLTDFLEKLTLKSIIGDRKNKFYEAMSTGQDFSI
jgi:Rrf2 family transcriptional regulator, iron-sulfur cluster assembly transcription factor